MKEANLRAIMLVQHLEETHWSHWEDKAPVHQARGGNCLPLLEAVINRLNTSEITVSEAYGIIHDKDTITLWNQEQMKNITEKKEKHIHFLFKFEKGATLNKLALAIGQEPQYLEKLKSGRYGYDNCLAYLVHAKDESKFQYSPDEVVTVLGESYSSLYHRKMEAWVKGRATKQVQETNLSVDWLVSEILDGRLSKSQILSIDKFYKVYGQHKRRINEALETSTEKKGFQAVLDIEAGRFKKTIFFIYGESGNGKTRLSKQLIKILQKIALKQGKIWEVCSTASTNAFDEYNGEDILLLDDIRGYSLTASDWLKLLDPYNISPISARYKNKLGSAKVIIITSTKWPIDFFEAANGNDGEDLGQFIRRIDTLVSVQETGLFLSTPTKIPIEKRYSFDWNRGIQHSYRFSQNTFLDKKATINNLVKTVLRNMKWHKKEHISTDQSKQMRSSQNSKEMTTSSAIISKNTQKNN